MKPMSLPILELKIETGLDENTGQFLHELRRYRLQEID